MIRSTDWGTYTKHRTLKIPAISTFQIYGLVPVYLLLFVLLGQRWEEKIAQEMSLSCDYATFR